MLVGGKVGVLRAGRGELGSEQVENAHPREELCGRHDCEREEGCRLLVMLDRLLEVGRFLFGNINYLLNKVSN